MDLPTDLWKLIIDYLGNRDKCTIMRVNKKLAICVQYFDQEVDINRIRKIS